MGIAKSVAYYLKHLNYRKQAMPVSRISKFGLKEWFLYMNSFCNLLLCSAVIVLLLVCLFVVTPPLSRDGGTA